MIRRIPRPQAVSILLAFSLALLTMAPAPAAAATVVLLTLEEMEALATDIIVGTVQSTKAEWDKDHRIIETRVKIRVDQPVKGKGKGGKLVTVVVPGGVVGEIGMRQSGAAVFAPGERVLLLAEPKRPSELRPVGLFQGKMAITHDAARGIDVVEPPGPAWGMEGEPLPPGTMPEGRPPALPLTEVLRRLGVTP